MPTNARVIFALAVSLAMIGLGLFVAFRPLWSHDAPLTGTWWLDGGFAIFFIVRGLYGVRMTRRWSGAPPAP